MGTRSITVRDLQNTLERGDPVTVLDIRPSGERADWAIPGSVHIDAYDALKAGDTTILAGLDLPSDEPVVTVCAAGNTAKIAAAQLQARGMNAAALEGGMKAWSLARNTAWVPMPDSTVRVMQVRRTGKGCLSYSIGSKGEALVIDASLDPDAYCDLAGQHGWSITKVLDSHVHADHLSRSRQLTVQTGATFFMPTQDRVCYPFTPLQDGDTVAIGDSALVVLATPGHTLESVSYLLDGRALFTGDTLFPAAVGRPDLEADTEGAARRAHLLYRSLQRIGHLSPDTLILAGHTSQPVPFNGEPLVSTLRQVTEAVPMLGMPEETFVAHILGRIPPTPPNHHRIVELNEAGQLPAGDATDLEAGPNHCAVA